MKMNVPMMFTASRVLLIPVVVIAFYLPGYGHVFSAIIFALAALTDWVDGYLARSLKQVTKLGAFLDPVADKLLVAFSLVIIVDEFGSIYLAIPAAIIISREILISALREWMAEIGKRTSVAVNKMAKIKTAVQMTAIFILLLYRPGFSSLGLQVFGVILLYVASVLTLWSMIIYLKAAWQDLTSA
jgi:CDP-diacylglycerol--glycerol-3-phosphate 3-phosphatidyltransferase